MTDTIDRHKRLMIMAPLCLLATTGRSGAATTGRYDAVSGIPDVLKRCFHDTESARFVGEAYLTDHAHEGSVEFLGRRVFGRDLHRVLDPDADVGAMRELIRERSREDFATGNTVSVQGWILARSEARVYAAIALG